MPPRSGLRPHFASVEVLPEKHEDAYRVLAVSHACDRQTTWMIGNSPKSDINPALAAGLNGIFIPHDFTWVLEHEVLNDAPPAQHLVQLQRFAQLRELF